MKTNLADDIESFFEQMKSLILDFQKADDSESSTQRIGLFTHIIIALITFLKTTIVGHFRAFGDRARDEVQIWKSVFMIIAVLLIFLATAWLFVWTAVAALFNDLGFAWSLSILFSFLIQIIIVVILVFMYKKRIDKSMLAKMTRKGQKH